MTHKWTDEQWDAISARGGNLLVSAAAGAGKTAVLVERIIGLLTDSVKPVDIDRLLVVTFTEAAAAEMRERVGLALEKCISADNDGALSVQLSLLHGAAISTLHSFCLDVIKSYFYRLDMDPSFRVADGQEAAMLQQEVMEQLLEDSFISAENETFLALADRYGGSRGDNKLSELILGLYRFMQSNPKPESWLSDAVAGFNIPPHGETDVLLLPWLEPVRRKLSLELSYASQLLALAANLTLLPGAPEVYSETILDERERVEGLASLLYAPWEQLRSGWRQFTFKSLPATKNADEDLKKRIARLRDQAKYVIKSSAEIYFERDGSEYAAEIRELAPLVAALAEITRRFSQSYADRKKMLGILDFNDLEHFCLEILTEDVSAAELQPSAAATDLRQYFEYVLVDEYQDINPVQDAILNLVSRQGEEQPNLFMVGDVKQSIYRFRLADPGLFLGRYQKYPDSPGSGERRISLSHNFRCRFGVVAAVNFLFRQLMTTESAETAYEGAAELVYGDCYPEQDVPWPVEVHIVETGRTDQSDASDEEEADVSGIEREGKIIAGRIREMAASDGECQIFDSSQNCYRPLLYRDIAILMRATAGRANKLVEVLRRFDIPAYAELSTGYFDSVEVEAMISLLKVVDNPRQDIPLAAVLRSPLVGLDSGELGRVRLLYKNGDFYDAVVSAAEAELPGLSGKLDSFLTRLNRWRDLARRERLTSFIAAVYSGSGLVDYVGGLPEGVQRQANLHSLFERARQFDRFSRQGLSRFLRFIDQLKSSGEDMGTPGTLAAGENVVRVMSIHKSKGLEFPVVIICDLGKKFNLSDVRREILFHRRMGISPIIVNTAHRLRYPSLPYLALRLQSEEETRAEEMRIFYVALTRARERLILVGSVRDAAREVEKWQLFSHWPEPQLPAAHITRALTCLEWLGMALARHDDISEQKGHIRWRDSENSRFRLKLWGDTHGCPLPSQQEENKSWHGMAVLLQTESKAAAVDPALMTEIRERVNFRYSHTAATLLPAKLSVTEVKNRLYTEDDNVVSGSSLLPEDWPQPSFSHASVILSPMERGIVYHLVMEKLDLWEAVDEKGVKKQLMKMVAENILTKEQSQQVEIDKITGFFKSAAGAVVLENRENVVREMPFLMAMPASRLYQPQDLNDSIIVQGVIDLVANTEKGCIIIDYKTGRAPEDGQPAAKQHFLQLSLYAEAASRILDVEVTAAYIYYFDSSSLVTVNLNNYKYYCDNL
jgi:ATP-dependent helicase/nuclease subunit A